jgi:benzylsuccinate CoA-transferase BbsE subunit
MTKQEAEGMLSPYRVLDLTDEKGLFCGKMMGDVGADVIKIEKPGGDPARSIGPFYHDEPDPEKSLFWFAFNTSKRGITLDIETADGQAIFKKLVKSADFVIESFPPGYMDKLGLGYKDLEKLNPGIIMVSITPFGQTGPYKDYKGPDIVTWAMGGEMYVSGEADRPPVRISHHSNSYLHAASEGAIGAMAALYYRNMTGEGQQVDVSIQENVTRPAHLFTTIPWDSQKVIGRRGSMGGPAALKRQWPCKDGYVVFSYWGGPTALRFNMPVIQLMEDEGIDVEFLKSFDWVSLDMRGGKMDKETIQRIEEPTSKFFMMNTKAELLDKSIKYNCPLYPVSTTADMPENPQLVSRDFWVDVEHPELGTTITYPGPFVNASETPPVVSRRAPLIGEHNNEIYEQELGMSGEELLKLKQAGVI